MTAKNDAAAPLAPGSLLTIGSGSLVMAIAPHAGGRIAQIRHRGVDVLVGHGADTAGAIAWGCYPMVPWAGRVRHGRFRLQGRAYELPCNFGAHAIHGVGFLLPWQVDAQASDRVTLSLALPGDQHWPFGGIARQSIEVAANRVRLSLSVTAGARAMPACIGWHPWFRKPDRLGFAPASIYPRDADGLPTLPLAPPPPGPWDDCFVNDAPVTLHYGAQRLRLTSNCTHWVVYDQPVHASCVEPQTGPPDAFNLAPRTLAPGETLEAWLQLDG